MLIFIHYKTPQNYCEPILKVTQADIRKMGWVFCLKWSTAITPSLTCVQIVLLTDNMKDENIKYIDQMFNVQHVNNESQNLLKF